MTQLTQIRPNGLTEMPTRSARASRAGPAGSAPGWARPILFAGITLVSAQPASAAGGALPPWLAAHVGLGPGQIAPVVLERARALYQRKVGQGRVRNPCYFAMDATRPHDAGPRFYTICESSGVFRAVASGHGSGRVLNGLADFSNGRSCAKNFGNAQESMLTAGGDYMTAETKTSFKAYYRLAGGREAVFTRSFVQFEGEGETANARPRAIGGHAAQIVKGLCLRRQPDSPYANADGYVPVGSLVDYASGRSNGCTSWSSLDARQIVGVMNGNPTTLYIYPESRDIDAVARAVAGGHSPAQAGLYWNASCLQQIRAPRFWARASLEPIIARYDAQRAASPPHPLPICSGP